MPARHNAAADPGAWDIVAYLLSGMLLWGGAGWLLDRWLGLDVFLPIGLLFGYRARALSHLREVRTRPAASRGRRMTETPTAEPLRGAFVEPGRARRRIRGVCPSRIGRLQTPPDLRQRRVVHQAVLDGDQSRWSSWWRSSTSPRCGARRWCPAGCSSPARVIYGFVRTRPRPRHHRVARLHEVPAADLLALHLHRLEQRVRDHPVHPVPDDVASSGSRSR